MRKVGRLQRKWKGIAIEPVLIDLKEKIVEIVKLKERLRKVQAKFVEIS